MQANFFEILPLIEIYLFNSIVLFVGTGILATALGVITAALVSFYRFPGVKIMRWALFLPFSIPSYIIAYRIQDFFDYSGPVQHFMRRLWGVSWLPDTRSLFGLIILFTLVLYPYVYLLARSSFCKQSETIIDAARLMGRSYWRALITTSIPLCWPAIIAGTSLVLLEVLNEYGAVSLSSAPTLSVGITDLWWSLGDQYAASQLAIIALLFAMLFYLFENLGRGNKRFYQLGLERYHHKNPPILRGRKRYIALAFCLIPLFFGFLLPLSLLIFDVVVSIAYHLNDIIIRDYIIAFKNSFLLATITAGFCTALGIIASYILRHKTQMQYLVRFIQSGYALPGALLAIGITLGFASLNNFLANLPTIFGYSLNIALSGTVILIIFAYICRFNHVAISGIYSHMQKLSPEFDEVASTLGHKKAFILKRIHLPLIDKGIWAVFLLVFIDVLKELPASLLLRPLDFNTLAIHVYEYASDERIEQAAPGALIIVLVGLFPVIYLSYLIDRVNHE